MTILPIVKDDLKALTTPTEPFDFTNPPCDPLELTQNMIETMYALNGLGLAANQVGVPWSVFVMRGNPADFACFNPRLTSLSDEVVLLEESCLSFPGLIVKVKRPKHCRVRFTIPNGETVTQQFTGMTARCVQHEMDHLAGYIWYLRGSKYHRDLGQKNRGKYARASQTSVRKVVEVSPFDVIGGSR